MGNFKFSSSAAEAAGIYGYAGTCGTSFKARLPRDQNVFRPHAEEVLRLRGGETDSSAAEAVKKSTTYVGPPSAPLRTSSGPTPKAEDGEVPTGSG